MMHKSSYLKFIELNKCLFKIFYQPELFLVKELWIIYCIG